MDIARLQITVAQACLAETVQCRADFSGKSADGLRVAARAGQFRKRTTLNGLAYVISAISVAAGGDEFRYMIARKLPKERVDRRVGVATRRIESKHASPAVINVRGGEALGDFA